MALNGLPNGVADTTAATAKNSKLSKGQRRKLKQKAASSAASGSDTDGAASTSASESEAEDTISKVLSTIALSELQWLMLRVGDRANELAAFDR